MAKAWVQQEAALGTVFSALDRGRYEILDVHYYWSNKAAKYVRTAWKRTLHGFHRCRHDHEFVENLFKVEGEAWVK